MMTFPKIDAETWKKQAEKESGGSFESLRTKLREGITLDPLYTSAPSVDAPVRWGDRAPRIATRHDTFDPAAVAADIQGGACAIFLQLDRAARLGREADTLRDGAAISTARELSEMVAPFDLKEHRLFLDAGANVLPTAALMLAANDRARVLLMCDPLGALARDGALPRSLDAIEHELIAVTRYFAENRVPMSATTVSTRVYHEAGADAADEIAIGLATGVYYLRLLDAAGIDHQPQTFSFAIGRDVFLEISKLRAFRLAWRKVLQVMGRKGGIIPLLHAEASRRTLTRRDPWMNLLRVTTEVFAAICGGADLVTPQPFDAALGDASELGRRIARNTPIVLLEEGQLWFHADPARGSYYVETLTDALAREGWRRFQEIEAAGGMRDALLSGKIAQRVAASAKALVAEKQPIIGVTEFAPAKEERLERPSSAKPRTKQPPVEVGGPNLLSLFAAASRGASIFDLSEVLDDGEPPPKIPPFELRRDEGGAP